MCRRGSAFEKRTPGDARRVDCRDGGRIRSRDLKARMSYGLRERMGFGPERHGENIAQTVMEASNYH